MTEFPFKRRDLLRVTGAGLLGTAGVAQSTSPGDELWSVQTDANVRSSPTVVDETVFVGSGDGFPSGGVSALAASDGSEKWTFQTDEGVESSPAVVDETVFIGESRNGTAYALDASDGSTKWQAQPSEAFRSSPTVADGTVFVGGYAEVYALDASDGSENWRFQTGGIVHTASPTVVDGTVFVGSNAVPYAGGNPTVYALDASDGSEQWRFETGGYCQSSPTVADGTVFIGSNDNNVYALDASNGSKKWTFQTNNLVQSSPTVVDGTVFVGSDDATIYALDASDGSEQWRFETGDPIESSPTVVGGTVFVGSNDTNVYALDASDGSEQWRFETGGAVRSSPTVVDGTVFVGSNDTNVYALEAGVSGASEGSRVNLGTLGHHNAFAENGPTPPGGGGSGGGELDLSVQAGTAPPGGTYTLTYQITNTGSTTIGDGTNSLTGVSPEINQRPPGFTTNERSIPDGGAVDGFTWFDWSIDPGETITAELQVALELPDDIDPGEYEFTIVAQDNAQSKEFDRASGTVTVTDPGQNRFDPKVHGFEFKNWGIDGGEFTPPHEHNSITEEAFRTEFDQEWLPEIKNSIPVPLPGNVVTEAFEAVYDTLRRGPEQLWSDGHCYGMCIVAERYFETSPPDSLPDDPPTAASIDKPSGEYERVGTEVDQEHRKQFFDSRVLKEVENLGPRTPQAEGTIDAEAEVKAIRSAIEQDGTALVGIGSSPSFYASISVDFTRRLHQLIATGVTVNGSSLKAANTATIEVYDPNQRATFYKTNSRQLTVDVSTPTPQPIMNNSGAGYTGLYQRFGLIGPARADLLPADEQFKLSIAAVQSFISNFTDGFMIFAANSPVRIDATAPDGTQFNHPDSTVEGVPPEEVVYLTDAPVGEYEITVEGTGSGEYGIEGVGSVPNAGQIGADYTGRISAGETQRLSATLPERGEESGTVTPPDSDPDPDTDTEIDVTRQVSSTEVSPGGEVTLTTEVSGVSGSDSVSITSSSDPALNSAPTGSVAVDDGALSPSNIDADASPTGSTLTVSNLDTTTTTDSGSVTVTVTETLSVAEEAGVTHSLTGSVTTGETTVEVDPVSVSVRADGSTSVVDEYDTNNDGTISITELGRGGADFASGELSITELGKLGAAFASSSSSSSGS